MIKNKNKNIRSSGGNCGYLMRILLTSWRLIKLVTSRKISLSRPHKSIFGHRSSRLFLKFDSYHRKSLKCVMKADSKCCVDLLHC